MSDVLGFLVMAGIVIGVLVVSIRNREGNVATRRHARYQRKFTQADTHHEKLRHASAYLHEVAGASDAKTAAVAKELFALATKHNGAPAPGTAATVTARKPV